ncbi:metallophosphoesterase [Prosthecobacter sp.]|uniref:metallophosphoesterase family protein n=1 Tax=Prosthecobacter sp. TaxID=1965333 RepID=UPI002ABA8D46|nr:metallophosphoesterase [Prosthecobacter sp.]MDZ4403561.1 metallophosphoesterase [Prosthecobacter sp.]
MPLHLTSRRQFITQFGAAVALSQVETSAAEVDDNLIAILNDTHIGAQHLVSAPIPTNLRNTVAYLLALPKRPAAVVINGDLALKDGKRGDYEHFARLIAPLRDAGVSLHLTMGNHDDRAMFYEVLKSERPESPAVESKHVGVVKLAGANLFLLDSLKATMVTQGLIGDTQMAWLTKLLDQHADKPALVFAHHNPRLGGDPLHFPGGLEDSETLWKAFAARKHIKAYIHGHIHHRDFYAHEGIHILNTPATSYVANKQTSTTGWTMARLSTSGGAFTTHTHIPEHAWNGVTVDLKWRS